MSESEEIEVEVVEVVDQVPDSKSSPQPGPSNAAERQRPRGSGGRRRSPFGGAFSPRTLRIPTYLWPLAFILGLVLFLVAVVLGLIIVIPFLIIRAIVRLLIGPSR